MGKWNFSTKAIHAAQGPEKENRAISQPIIPAVAYAFDHADEAVNVVNGKDGGTYYGRYGNPTTRTLEEKIASLEGSEDALGVSRDRKSTRLNSSHVAISYAVFCLKKKSTDRAYLQNHLLRTT